MPVTAAGGLAWQERHDRVAPAGLMAHREERRSVMFLRRYECHASIRRSSRYQAFPSRDLAFRTWKIHEAGIKEHSAAGRLSLPDLQHTIVSLFGSSLPWESIGFPQMRLHIWLADGHYPDNIPRYFHGSEHYAQ